MIHTLKDAIHGTVIPDQKDYVNTSPLRTITTDRIIFPSAKLTDLLNTQALPPKIDKAEWERELFLELIRILQSYKKKELLYVEQVMALWKLAMIDTPDHVGNYEQTSSWTLNHNATGGFSAEAKMALEKRPKMMAFLAYTDLTDPERTREAAGDLCHYLFAIYVFKQRRIYVFDTINDGLKQRAGHIEKQLTLALKSWNPVFEPKKMVTFSIVDQRDGWSCGYWCGLTLYLIMRRPKVLLDMIRYKTDPYVLLEKYIASISAYIGIKVIDSPPADLSLSVPSQKSKGPVTKNEPRPKTPVTRTKPPKPSTPKKQMIRSPSASRTPKRSIETAASDSDAPIEDFLSMMDLNKRHSHNPGPHRADQYRHGELTPYRWTTDTYETAASRPQPSFPTGWPGWDEFESQLEQTRPKPKKVIDQAKSRAERAEARARKRVKAIESDDEDMDDFDY
ncbi:hypothetical protein F4815DRAFT_497229 [Daldinia loculata]|nr:hypothetical protein F4815DRAFT_497229 [Daldinia loculata]